MIVGQCPIYLAELEVRIGLRDVFGALALFVQRGNSMHRNTGPVDANTTPTDVRRLHQHGIEG